MGKNSLVKSTTKKKNIAKKKSATRKTESTPENASPRKAPPAAGAGKPKSASAKGKTARGPKKGPQAPSLETLLFRRFDAWRPEKPFVPPVSDKSGDYTAPPFFTGKSGEEAERLRALLFKKFDLDEAPPPAPEKAAAPTPKAEKIEKKAPAAAPSEPDLSLKEIETKTPTAPSGTKGKDKTMKTDTTQKAKDAPEPEKKPPLETSFEPEIPIAPEKTDPVDRAMKFVIAGFALLVLILIAQSASNSKTYVVKPANGGIEIWKGNFAPIGQKRFLVLPGAQAPEKLKDHYSKTEAYSLAFGYYLQKSDALLEVSGMPDFEGIRKSLQVAGTFAATDAQRAVVNKRLNHIDFMLLVYKADVALGKGTLEGAENAMAHLEQAGALELEKTQQEMVKGRMDAARKAAAGFKAKVQEPAGVAKKPAPASK